MRYLLIAFLIATAVGCKHKKEGWIVKGQDGNYYKLVKAAPNESYSLELIDTAQLKFIFTPKTLNQ